MTIQTAAENDYSSISWIPTGFANLDKIMGGGIPLRRITELSGSWGLGKTTLALTIVAQAQKQGYKTLWVDQEWAWEPLYGEKLGVDLKKLFLLQERFAEVALDSVEEWAESNKKALIVIDAIGALLPRAEAEKDNSSKTIGGQAGLVARFSRKIVPILAINNIALLVLNHEYIDIMSSRIMTSGGAKLAYSKSIGLRLKKGNKRIMSGENKVGEVVIAEVRKNKLNASTGMETELQMVYGSGFSHELDLLENALEKGVITKVGQFYYFNNEKAGRGINGIREALKDPSFAEKITNALS